MTICNTCGKEIDYCKCEPSKDTVKSFSTEGMPNPDFLRIWNHSELLEKLHGIYVKKNAAYGNSFDRSLDRWGYQAALVRMDDKMNRLEQLLLKNGEANDESALDTALDLANYSVMLAMYIESKK